MLSIQQALNKCWMNKQAVTAAKLKAQGKKRRPREGRRHSSRASSPSASQPDTISCLWK